MNITPLNNPLTDSPQETNNSNADSSWANQIIRSITPKRCILITANVLISAGSLSGYLCLSECYPLNYIYITLYASSIYIAHRLITRRYQSDSSENIADSPKIRNLKISYNELTELPRYNDSDKCPITFEALKQGDTVCCDKQLYSFNVLKKYYEEYNNDLIPHNRQPLDWSKVYKLPTYGVAPTS